MPQHRAVYGSPTSDEKPHAASRKIEQGSIAMIPEAHAEWVDAIENEGLEIAEVSKETRGLIWTCFDPIALIDLLKEFPNIQWVQLILSGVDEFAPHLSQLVQGSDRKDLIVTSAKGSYAQPVAEHALTLTLALLRLLHIRARANTWTGSDQGSSLFRLNVTIVGAGGIGVALMDLLKPFEVKVTVVRKSHFPVSGAHRTLPCAQLEEALVDADVVILASALTPETTDMISISRLRLMKKSAILVNVGRGGLVNQEDLIEALNTDVIAAAALDVTVPEPLPNGHPLWSNPRCLITPHAADTPEMCRPLLAERFKLNARAFKGEGNFVGVVNVMDGY